MRGGGGALQRAVTPTRPRHSGMVAPDLERGFTSTFAFSSRFTFASSPLPALTSQAPSLDIAAEQRAAGAGAADGAHSLRCRPPARVAAALARRRSRHSATLAMYRGSRGMSFVRGESSDTEQKGVKASGRLRGRQPP